MTEIYRVIFKIKLNRLVQENVHADLLTKRI